MKEEQFNIHSQFSVQKLSRRQVLRRLGGLGLVIAGGGVSVGLSSVTKAATSTPTGATEIYRFKVGNFDCVAIDDGYSILPASFYAANAPIEQVEQLLSANGLPSDQVTNRSICLVIDTGKNVVLVDTGFGSIVVPGFAGPTGGKLQQNLQAAGIRREDIDTVMITHAHPDHIGGVLDDTGKLAFPNARYVFWRTEWDFWTSEPSLSELGTGDAAEANKEFFLTNVRKRLPSLRGHLRLLHREVEVVPGIRAIAAPGHTPGHMAIAVSSGSERLLHVGDAPGHYILSLEHPDWYLGVDLDPQQALRTRRQLFDQAATDRSMVFAYHFPFPGLGYVTKSTTEDKWEWEALGYSVPGSLSR
ncbi:MBL fold metallo-hydrolase [Scytonema sp. PCC 10023]|uniref:MBL fold metallo-hydrolase n=1 Tax=Scytonema sp. PCC 10023 TaxID=1680591 RepID=UPI0039C68870